MRTSKTTGKTSSGDLPAVLIVAAALLCVAPPRITAQTDDQPLGLILSGILSTGGDLVPDPSSSGTLLRQAPPSLGTGFGYGVELRYRLPSSNIAVGLSLDHSSASVSSTTRSSTASARQAYPVEDGYRAYAAEITGYFYIPVGGPSLSLFMGGGCGGYWGERVFRMAGVEAPVTGSIPGFGIHVLGGAGYRIFPHTSVLFTMKFRELQFESTNAFAVSRISYGSSTIQVGTAPFSARVQANSVLFSLGLMISL